MTRFLLDSKTILITLILSFSIYSSLFGKEIDQPGSGNSNPGADIPKVTVSELKKKISAFEDKVIIVDFWATWCPPCEDEIPGFINLYKKYKDKGVEILGIALDIEGSKAVKPFAKKMGINYPLYIGGYDMHQEFEIAGLPTTLIFNKKGKLKVKHVGYASEREFEHDILNLLK